MEFKDITTWLVKDGIAKPSNPFIQEQKGKFIIVNVDEIHDYAKFQDFARLNTYPCSPDLDGEYSSDEMELVWQYKCEPDFIYEWDGCLDNNPDLYLKLGVKVRPFLQLMDKAYWDKHASNKLLKTLDLPEVQPVESNDKAKNIALEAARELYIEDLWGEDDFNHTVKVLTRILNKYLTS